MRRRAFVAWLAGAAVSPRLVRAQPTRKWLIGFLHPGRSAYVTMRVAAFREGLGGERNELEIVAQIAEDDFDRLSDLATDLVRKGPQAICAVSPPAIWAARTVTQTVPIVGLDLESDPVASGWAQSLARPGGNLTGIFLDLPDFTAKCLQLLREALPGASRAAVLWHPATGTLQLEAARSAAEKLGLALQVFQIGTIGDFEPAFRE